MNKKIRNVILGISSAIIILGTSLYIYDCTRPYNIYEKAITKTENENIKHIKNKLISNGEIEELSSQSIDYMVDNTKKIIEIKKNILGKDETSEMLIVDNKLYSKDGEEYINIIDSDYLEEVTSNIKIEGNTTYDNYRDLLMDSVESKDIVMTKETKKVDNKDVALKVFSLTIDKEKAKNIISTYIEKDYIENLDVLVNETINSQIEISKATNVEYTEEEIQELNTQLKIALETSLKEKLNTIEYSDIKILVGVDSSGYVRYREESYDISIDGKGNTITNITEYIAFGSTVEITNPDNIKIKTVEEMVQKQTEEKKKTLKEYALDNPDKEVSVAAAETEKTQKENE